MMDSSPVALPPLQRRVPKRSASVASLPTPPRTRRRTVKRPGSRAPSVSGSDHDSAAASSDEELRGAGEEQRPSFKKRRLSMAQEAEDEDAFWMGSSRTVASGKASASRVEDRELSESPTSSPVPLVYRKLQGESSVVVAPMSPPPSRRQPRILASSAGSSTKADLMSTTPLLVSPNVESPPVTPVRKSRKSKAKGPIRDSPDNPFLASPAASDAEEAEMSGTASEGPSPKTPPREKPTLTYVFRGVKTEFMNPLYDHVNNRPLSPDPDSRLPPEHPDYSGDLSCPPTVLFPEAHRAQKRRRPGNAKDGHARTAQSSKRNAVVDPFDDSPEPRPLRRSPRNIINLGDRGDMMRRAMGPKRL
ncbi:hypothetical protein HGRIS_000660 [Hohenbuehelia grisea]|uniref:Uncharacterized protein n=1 Tax=Hohenbuehelia grisea TaxID=104357 RepID=A0ABR3JRM7_9AGAR